MSQKSSILLEKAGLVAAIIFAVLLPYDMLYSTVAIYPLALIGLLSIKRKTLRRIPKQSWIFCIIFLISLSGYFWSTDMGRAGYLLERQLTILVFPFLLPLAIDINSQNLKIILRFFSLSCLVAVLYLFGVCIAFIQAHNLSLSALSQPRFYHHNFSLPINIHAGFLSLYVSLAITFLINEIPSARKTVKFFCITAILLLCGGLYFLASRNTIITILMVICLVFPVFMAQKRKWIVVLLSFGVVAIFFAIGMRSSYIHQRFSKELLGDLQISKVNAKEYPESRIVRWQCALDLIEQKPYFGYGTGEEIPLLKNEYRKRQMWVSYFEEFNTHNQYLAVVLKHGLLGLLVFLTMLVYFFYLALKSGSFIHFSFMLILTIGFVTENIIDANKGIFFFAFFNTLLGYNSLRKIKEKRERQTLDHL